MVVVLIVAAVISALTHEITDAIVIGIILVLNAVLGFFPGVSRREAMPRSKHLSVPVVRGHAPRRPHATRSPRASWCRVTFCTWKPLGRWRPTRG
jgi:magnesium-transporting ATPase (P-type)